MAIKQLAQCNACVAGVAPNIIMTANRRRRRDLMRRKHEH